jgi:alpha-tubulin suppressor-like RCC1 family protein
MDSHTPIQIGQDAEWLSAEAGMRYTVATKKDGTLWAWGLNQNGQLGNGKNKNNHTPVQIGN